VLHGAPAAAPPPPPPGVTSTPPGWPTAPAPAAPLRYEAVALSWDHKPSRPDERARILAAGGRVERWNATRMSVVEPAASPSEGATSESSAAPGSPAADGGVDGGADETGMAVGLPLPPTPPPPAIPYDDEEEEDSAVGGPERVWLADRRLPGLALSRAFGDGVAKSVGVTSTPDVSHLRLTPADAFLILASDGVWDWVPSSEAVRFVAARRAAKESPQTVAEALVRLAARRWAVRDAVTDDVTAVIVYFEHHLPGGEGVPDAPGAGGGRGGGGPPRHPHRRAEVGAGRVAVAEAAAAAAAAAVAVKPNDVERLQPRLSQPAFAPARPPLVPEGRDPSNASSAAPLLPEEFQWET